MSADDRPPWPWSARCCCWRWRLHGWWQTRRAQPRQAVDPDRRRPNAWSRRLGAAEATAAPPEPAALRTAPRRVPRLDALIDAIVPLALEAPISGEMALSHLPPTRRAGSKPFYIEGLDTESGQWEPFAPGHRYGELQAGVQLASRSGALNEIEYSEFVQKVETFAEAVGASADVPDMLEVVARARELDALAGPLDAQLTVTLRSNGVAWSVGYVQQVAARLGFVTGPVPGRLVLPAAEEGAPPMLVLSVDPQAALAEEPQAAAVRECVLVLDVPQTPESAEPFPAFHRAATTLADDLDATRHRRPGPAHHAARLRRHRPGTAAAVPAARGAGPGRRQRGGAAAVQLTRRCDVDRRPCPPRRRVARAAATPRAPLLRARRAGDPRRRIRPPVPGIAVHRGRAPRTADTRLAHAAGAGPGADRPESSAACGVDARRSAPRPTPPQRGAEAFDAACGANWRCPTTHRRWPTPPS